MIKPTTNIREIAKMAGVSVASVSRALQSEPSPKLSEKQRKHILDICTKMQYCPNEHTRRLFSRRSNTVAIFFPPQKMLSGDFGDTYIDMSFGACLIGAQSGLIANGIDLLLTEISPELLKSKRYISMIRSKIIDGVLLWGVMNQDKFVPEILEEGIPTVMLQTALAETQCSRVVADDYGGMKRLTERVLAAGHRRIAVAPASSAASAGQNRTAGILETLQAHGVKPEYIKKEYGFGYNYGESAAREILENAPHVTCIMCPNDMAAYGCIDELKKHKISVPHDISVTGADGLKLPGCFAQIDSFFSPAYEIGRQGANLLYEQINGNSEFKSACLPVTDVPGGTIRNLQ